MRASWPDELGDLARQRRLDLGLSQGALADRAGTTRQWLSRFEAGKGDVSLAKALEVVRELDLALDVVTAAQSRDAVSPREGFHLPLEAIDAVISRMADPSGSRTPRERSERLQRTLHRLTSPPPR
ncbi:helix-turn-helix transcriptional regulator [Frondihabitans peucedani]|jgi:transcriptional regulator with XRE-family HTH domain|uniref:HTH cro/C1-type domain-containing protein n=1 Tax=Frondihabitans peucedani TaxID=598626 RepID=A0ABP8E443_9MICO